MTLRDLYDYALIEMNKVEAPSLLLEDFNYYMNKAVQQYINKVYNRYDINQQSSDDLRVLKATTVISESDIHKTQLYNGRTVNGRKKISYWVYLPEDYMHILNCIVEYKVKKSYKCYAMGDHVDFPARRLTADMASGILHNVYMSPKYKRPYFYINNISDFENFENNADVDLSTYPYQDEEMTFTKYADSVKPADGRVSNVSKIRLELRFGEDDTIFEPFAIYIDYIKSPMFIRLTQQDITDDADHTRPLEFPDYVCYEIVNEFVKLLMENASDPRLQTNYAINQTVADPTAVPQSQSSRDRS